MFSRILIANRGEIAVRIILPLLIIAGGWALMKVLWTTEEKERSDQSRRSRGSKPKVQVVELRRSDFPVTITSQGVVEAHNSTSLTPPPMIDPVLDPGYSQAVSEGESYLDSVMEGDSDTAGMTGTTDTTSASGVVSADGVVPLTLAIVASGVVLTLLYAWRLSRRAERV